MKPDEVNFWQPSGTRHFRALQPGELFVFKLHSPHNYIVGAGHFVRYSALPVSIAWDAFGMKNGVVSIAEFRARISRYRRSDRSIDPIIGCNVLAEPFFLPENLWIPVPRDWAPNIVQGKTYDTEETLGQELWTRLAAAATPADAIGDRSLDLAAPEQPLYGIEYLAHSRLGQGAFRVLVTDAYSRRCAVTSERTLPVLEAAHIRPYSANGPHRVDNGILLRSDLHKLFDLGYVTITPHLRLEVSKRLREEWENGREYYAHHGQALQVMPCTRNWLPGGEFLQWHNEHVFKG